MFYFNDSTLSLCDDFYSQQFIDSQQQNVPDRK